ncbi:MAG: type II toxin-antitoxin system RelE/ParE family toxin [Defluviitaleaceae bacterium]|nr:type II toxin-antitoxin system RelE/ParE family toxin [Defluviitaleaceae bacterium]
MRGRYHVLVDPKADMKLFRHIEFLARVSEAAAEKLYTFYENALNELSELPTICPRYYSQKPIDYELYCKPFGKRYRIVFEIIDDNVYIYDIQDCRQDTDKNYV